jgi:exopolyphosphatase/guanosine-5'-triphosphate,3'-diphosphate pyrophosphatase
MKHPRKSGKSKIKAGGYGRRRGSDSGKNESAYAALDLGTNNCRLLIARPQSRYGSGAFRVVDALSKVVRLGEGMTRQAELAPAAMARTLEALSVCSDKIRRNRVRRARLVATAACRRASNGQDFLKEVEARTGLSIEIISAREEACLSFSSCIDLLGPRAKRVAIFDIGGGSTEIGLLRRLDAPGDKEACNGAGGDPGFQLEAMASFDIGVANLAERNGGSSPTEDHYHAMLDCARRSFTPFFELHSERLKGPTALGASGNGTPGNGSGEDRDDMELLGLSGTVTTLAALHMRLPQYQRRLVDGCSFGRRECSAVIADLKAMTSAERNGHPCIGDDRSDMIMAGCAIVEALQSAWPAPQLRVADRGLRDAIIRNLMACDGHPGASRLRIAEHLADGRAICAAAAV